MLHCLMVHAFVHCMSRTDADLGGVSATQDLTRHHARDGDNAHDTHLVEHRSEGQDETALQSLTGGLHACRSHGQQQLNAPLA